MSVFKSNTENFALVEPIKENNYRPLSTNTSARNLIQFWVLSIFPGSKMWAVKAFVEVSQCRHRRRRRQRHRRRRHRCCRRRDVWVQLRVRDESESDLAVLDDDGRRGHDLLRQVEALAPTKVFNTAKVLSKIGTFILLLATNLSPWWNYKPV